MFRIFISRSSTGLGLMAGKLLVENGHQVVLHARNGGRAEVTRRHVWSRYGHCETVRRNAHMRPIPWSARVCLDPGLINKDRPFRGSTFQNRKRTLLG